MKTIIFSDRNVMQIIRGNKEMTRRIVNPQPSIKKGVGKWMRSKNIQMVGDESVVLNYMGKHNPYGRPGDILHVKETFYQWGTWKKNGKTKEGRQAWRFVAKKGEIILFSDQRPEYVQSSRWRREGWHKRSPLFLPHNQCRLAIMIECITAERVQEITEAGAKLEGVLLHESGKHYLHYTDEAAHLTQFIYTCRTAKESFKTQWDLLHGRFSWHGKSWEANPYVFVISFTKTDIVHNKKKIIIYERKNTNPVD